MILDKVEIQALAAKKAEEHGHEVSLILAIIQKESLYDTFAFRYEPKFSYTYMVHSYANLNGISQMSEQVAQCTSWGLMQVMGAVARELQFKENLTMLTLPEIGLHYGCLKLARLKDKYKGSVPDAISAYNQGNNRKNPQGKYMNQRYVDDVLRYMNGPQLSKP